jgi:ligand-binding sensor domain-containing protein
MKLGHYWLTILFCLISSVALKAQQYSMQHFSVNEGLIQSEVNQIIQDKKKNIWIATNGGVSRFDGLKFKNYNIPISQVVNNLAEGKQHEIYASMEKGIGMIRNDSVYLYFFDQDMHLAKCRNMVFSQGKLWMITSRGVTIFDGKSFRVIHPFSSDQLNSVWFTIDNKGVIWIEDANRNIWHTENNKLVQFETEAKALKNGKELAAINEGNLYQISGENMAFLDHFDQKELNYLQRIGDSWYFTSDYRVFRKKGANAEVLFEASENDKITTLFVDKENQLWIGTHNGFYYSNSLAFRKFLIPGILDNRVYGVVEDDKKNVWFTSFGKGLTKFDGQEFKRIYSYKNQLNTDTFYTGSLKKSNGNLLFTTTTGVLQFDGKHFSKISYLPTQTYMHIYEDVANNMVIYAGEYSLVVETKDSLKVFNNLEYKLPQVVNILKDRNNIYRLGGLENTVFFDGIRFLPPDSARFGYIKGMYSSVIDNKKNIWFATRYGIMFYDYKSCKPIYSDEIIGSVLDLKLYFDKIYFGTIKGVGLIDQDKFYKNEKAVSFFDHSNGFAGEEVVQNGAIVSSDSSIWIPAARGVTKFSPSNVKDEDHLPLVQIESLISYNKNGDKSVVSGYELTESKDINLTYNFRDIEVNFHSNFFSDPEGVTYKYKLENYDYLWHEVPFSLRSLKYSQLPAGEYIFKICAFNRLGASNEIPTTIYINIASPFWQKWWFRIVSLIFVLFSIFEVFRKMKNGERRKADIQQQILKLKADSLAAQMNPHFVFNCISSINALINLGDKQEASIYLGRFATLLRSVLKSIRINEISLEEELSITENYMQLEQARYSNPFIYTIQRPSGMSLTKILIPPLIIQPFVENSVLHGFNRIPNYDKRINILAVISGDRLKIIINDNGSGIGTDNQIETGLGIKITKERIALLERNANVQIESHIEKDCHGTTITIEIPLKIKND